VGAIIICLTALILSSEAKNCRSAEKENMRIEEREVQLFDEGFKKEEIYWTVTKIHTMCSVRQSPIPSAPFFLAVIASSGVSALAKT
jgi:hypothetical protein